MVYMLFLGFIGLVTLTMPTPTISSMLLIAIATITLITGVSTRIVCVAANVTSSISDSFKASMLSVMAIALTSVFTFQILLKTSPYSLFIFPVIAFIAGAIAVRSVLHVGLGVLLVIGLVNTCVSYFAMTTIALPVFSRLISH